MVISMKKGLWQKGISFILVMVMVSALIPMLNTFVLAAESVSGVMVEGFLAPVEKAVPSANKIYTPSDLNNVRNDLFGSYVLMNDIDLSGYSNWSPIGGSPTSPFKGVFDGQGYKITGLKVNISITSGSLNPATHAAGLFGVCDGARIKNIEVNGVNLLISNTSGYVYTYSAINGRSVYAGGIAGYITNETIIYNSHVSGTIKATTSQEAEHGYAGGFAGGANLSIVSNSYSRAAVEASTVNQMLDTHAYAGGIIGYFNGEGHIDRSFNSGSVKAQTLDFGNAHAGGLVGQSVSSSNGLNITDAFNEGNVQAGSGNLFSGDAFSGGLVGKCIGTIDRTYNNGEVRAITGGYVGGTAYAGGICGQSDASKGIIKNSAIVQWYIGASGNSKHQYQISQSGQKSNNITTTSVASGYANDANQSFSDSSLKTSSPYMNSLGWDFDGMWEMVQGKDYPQLMPLKINEDDYITQHINFINGSIYSDLLANKRWTQIIWSAQNNARDNRNELLYNDAAAIKDIVNFKIPEVDNLYEILLADYIASQGTLEAIEEIHKINVDKTFKTVCNTAEKFLKEHWKSNWDELTDEQLFYIFHYNEYPYDHWEYLIQDLDSLNENIATIVVLQIKVKPFFEKS